MLSFLIQVVVARVAPWRAAPHVQGCAHGHAPPWAWRLGRGLWAPSTEKTIRRRSTRGYDLGYSEHVPSLTRIPLVLGQTQAAGSHRACARERAPAAVGTETTAASLWGNHRWSTGPSMAVGAVIQDSTTLMGCGYAMASVLESGRASRMNTC